MTFKLFQPVHAAGVHFRLCRRRMATMVLLQPPGACRAFTRSGSSYPPLGLCALAATVGPNDAIVVDADGMQWNEHRTDQELQRVGPIGLGLTVTSQTLDLVEYWAARSKGVLKDLTVVVGGPHASFDPFSILKACPSVDAVARGEGEVIF
eukprot:CAMPEP_0183367096 /NCGR_PEP_ID=MMETSP0164_2-20130417/91264_1 /TAXON_ID=221442 /ORGANISM="Coccolithus pelagicus ssp braarudi, Strain PLY182g" /LENGTH=150 /DNA_ID=CAMNT_0025542983 /DNA_START=29 /DNA_END=478 /DNA_ORIENTATION=+